MLHLRKELTNPEIFTRKIKCHECDDECDVDNYECDGDDDDCNADDECDDYDDCDGEGGGLR